MVSQPYSEGRRPYARNLSPYVAYTERHLQLPIGETKAIRMTEPVYSDPVPQRKRIAVAVRTCPESHLTLAQVQISPLHDSTF